MVEGREGRKMLRHIPGSDPEALVSRGRKALFGKMRGRAFRIRFGSKESIVCFFTKSDPQRPSSSHLTVGRSVKLSLYGLLGVGDPAVANCQRPGKRPIAGPLPTVFPRGRSSLGT